jgi:hypothetical protein
MHRLRGGRVNAATKLAAFAAGLALLFGGAAVAGGAIGPEPGEDAPQEHTEMPSAHAPDPVRGLAVADDGLRIVVDEPELRRGRSETLTFRVENTRGDTVRDFDVEHEKRMHLILARRDLTGFQHLHPEQAADGSWRTTAKLDEAGSYRLFADFSHDGEAQTLATDLRVDGAADLHPLPEPAATAVSDGGYDVRLDAGDDLNFTITKDGEPVRTEPYLGAGGHLVALREGDMAFLHVHPADDAVRFTAEFPTPGRYRLFLQFKIDGEVQTVGFTHEVS